MTTVETHRKVRRLLAQRVAIREIARECNISRNTVRKIRDTGRISSQYKKRAPQPSILDPFKEALRLRLESDLKLKVRERRKAIILYEEIQREGYTGGYDTVRRYVANWNEEHKNKYSAFVPLVFGKGEAFQFDWSTEKVDLSGEETTVQVAHFRLCYSRYCFVIAFMRQSTEMLLEAHVRAHNFFEGFCDRAIYDNLKTVVNKIKRGREREFNARYLILASHYLIEPTACTPASGNEKGQVEQEVDTLRDHFFIPRLHAENLEQINKHLEEQCRFRAINTKHPIFKDRTIMDVYLEEKPFLKRQPIDFDAYCNCNKKSTTTCLVYYDYNHYSVPCAYANRPIEIRAYAYKIDIYYDDKLIASHKRLFDRCRYSVKLEHYAPLLKVKPGAVRNGMPFRDEYLPEEFVKLKEILKKYPDGEKQFAHIMLAITNYGLETVLVATGSMIDSGCANETTILNAVSRLSEEDKKEEKIDVPEDLVLENKPVGNCQQYDDLIGA